MLPRGHGVVDARTCGVPVVSSVFSQTITFRSDVPETLVALAKEWDAFQASAEIMGYMGTRILADRDDPGRYVMISDFAVIDPDVSPAEEASLNNERPETQAMAERFRAVAESEPEWHHFDELYNSRLP
jgi:hypothetical protein